MTNEKKLEDEITKLTNQLREEKPAVYRHVTENPVTLPNRGDSDFLDALKQYKKSLIDLLEQ
jgi:hypothetical protein